MAPTSPPQPMSKTWASSIPWFPTCNQSPNSVSSASSLSLVFISYPFPVSHYNQSHYHLSHVLLHSFYNVTPHPLSSLFSPAPFRSQNDLWTHIFDHVTFHLKPFCCFLLLLCVLITWFSASFNLYFSLSNLKVSA